MMPASLNTPPAIAGYSRRPPCAALAPFVQCFWWLQADAGHSTLAQYLYADGGSGLIFNFATPLVINGSLHSQAVFANGPQLHSTALQPGHRVALMGVRFHPGMGYPFLGLALDELTLEDRVPGLALERLTDQLSQCRSTADQQQLLETTLLNKVGDHPFAVGPVHHLLERIARQRGTAPLAPLLAELSIGQRQLERQFRVLVGITPKQYSRLRRVGHARQQLKQDPRSLLLDVALGAGYFDQAHFIHDFRSVVGLTPGQYRKRARRSERTKKRPA